VSKSEVKRGDGMKRKTPDILLPALRQYQHNDCSGLVAGFDYDETVKIVSLLIGANSDSAQPSGSKVECTIDRLRGQLQNCANHLELLKRHTYRSDEKKIRDCIASANKALYETLMR